MSKSYLSYKALKKDFARKLIYALIIMVIIFAIALIRLAVSGEMSEKVDNPPKNEDAYAIAKEFIKHSLSSSDIRFPEGGYQCAQRPDSVYVIKSYIESKKTTGKKSVISFEITLRFIGGDARNKNSWKLIELTEN
jgi:hypothetical protein